MPVRNISKQEREGEEQNFQRLAGQLVSSDLMTRMNAVMELGKLGDKRAAPLLIGVLLGDKDGGMKIAAAEALGKIKDWRTSIEPIIHMMGKNPRDPILDTTLQQVAASLFKASFEDLFKGVKLAAVPKKDEYNKHKF